MPNSLTKPIRAVFAMFHPFRWTTKIQPDGATTLNFFLLLLLAIVTFYPLLYVGFTTNDDAEIAINFGWGTSLWETSNLKAELQGRITFFWGYPVLRLPYLLDSWPYYLAVKYGSFLMLLSALYFCISRIFKSVWIATAALLFFFAFIQNGWDHNALTSYPFAINLGASFLLTSLGLYSMALERKRIGWAYFSGVLYFFALANESFVLFFPLFVVMAASLSESNKKNIVLRLAESRRCIYPIFFPLAGYLVLYVSWRSFHTPAYDGTTFGGLNLLAATKVILNYSLSAFPFASINLLSATDHGPLFNQYYGPGRWNFILGDLNSSHFIKAAVAGFLVLRLMVAPSSATISNRRLIVPMFIVFICIFVPNLLLGFIGKHQTWVAAGSRSYLYTYNSFVAAVVFLALTLAYLNNLSIKWRPLFRKLFILFVVLLVASITFLVEFRNQRISIDQALSHKKWLLMDALINSDDFKKIPAQSTIYAPSLIHDQRGIAAAPADYWEKYTKYKTGRKFNWVTDSKEVKEPYFLLAFQQEARADNQYLVLAEMKRPEKLTSTAMTVYSLSRQSDLVVLGTYKNSLVNPEITIDGEWVQNVGAGYFSTKLSPVQYAGSVAISRIKGNVEIYPEQISMTHYPAIPQVGKFKLDLGDGFYGWESGIGEPAWSWAGEQGQILITNFGDEKLKAVLEFEVTSLKDATLLFDKKPVALMQVGIYKHVNIPLDLLPGANKVTLNSNQSAISPGGADSRKLGFSVRHLKIKSIGAVP